MTKFTECIGAKSSQMFALATSTQWNTDLSPKLDLTLSCCGLSVHCLLGGLQVGKLGWGGEISLLG